MSFCSSCGAKIADADTFCSGCGERRDAEPSTPTVGSVQRPVPPQTNATPTHPQPSQQNTDKGRASIIIAVVVVIGVVIVIGAAVNNGKQKQIQSYNSALLQNSLRFYQEGDQWTYSVTGQFSNGSGQTLDIASGTYTQTISKVTTDSGNRYYREDTAYSLVLSGGASPFNSTNSRTYKQDQSSFSTYVVSDTGGDNDTGRVNSNQVEIDTPGEFSASSRTDSQLTFDNGDSEHDVSNVSSSSPSTVATPAGTYSGWNYHQTEQDQPGIQSKRAATSSLSDGVFVPGIGNWATADVSGGESGGMSLKMHLTLTSTSVAKPS